jgi:chromosome segregation ATPase
MAIVSFETVAAAAEKLQAAGQRASVRAVIAELGGGSPNTVLKLLGEWKAGRPVVRIADTDLDPRITDSIKVQMQRIAEQAAAAAEERAAAIDEDLQALAEAQAAAEQQITGLTAERDTAQAQAADFVEQLAAAQADAARYQAQAAEALAAVRQELASERLRHEHAAAALARAEVRLESLPTLQGEVERLRQLLEEARQRTTEATQAAAVVGARLDAVSERAARSEKRVELLEQAAAAAAKDAAEARSGVLAETKLMQAELAEARRLAADAREQAAHLAGRLEASEIQLLSFRKQAELAEAVQDGQG